MHKLHLQRGVASEGPEGPSGGGEPGAQLEKTFSKKVLDTPHWLA
ncbi:hypothetical protein SAMN02910314_00001 [Denitrobacterium detoxificans]|uniref:Uncharacterized protein n=1 Tax=Denitrobacterium detoxificans TaxID=79604 RepID=A0A1H8P453_9ACTN|nr:hypothetical protein SAMN02910314_00001 [Denitrobacterium detoxificans]